MAIIQGNSAVESGIAAYEIPNSLKFNSADSAYLSWTPASNGTRTTWTISCWVKRSALSTGVSIAGAGSSGSAYFWMGFDSSNRLVFEEAAGGANTWYFRTTPLYRDPSAWYHIVVALDTTQATSTNRVKIYVNGTQVTVFDTSTYPTQNLNSSYWNATSTHNIGAATAAGTGYFSGYLTEFNFIDGQALDPTSFGEYNSETGVWQPIAYAGTYGTNGFYLPMTQDQIVEGFNTVLWRGNGGTQRITGVGFSPDLVWIKDRSNARNHYLYDSVRGALKELYSNLTSAESTNTIGLSSFGSDGFTLNNGDNAWNGSGNNYVGWCWDAGNTYNTTGSELISNGTFNTNTTGWTANNATISVENGTLKIIGGTGEAGAYQTITTEIGKSYLVVLDRISSSSADSRLYVGTSVAGTQNLNFLITGTGFNNAVMQFTATATTTYIYVQAYNGRTVYADNITVKEMVVDGSIPSIVKASQTYGFSVVTYTGNGSAGATFGHGLGTAPSFVIVKERGNANGWLCYHASTGNTGYLELDASLSFQTLSTVWNNTSPTSSLVTLGTVSNVNRSGGTYVAYCFAETGYSKFGTYSGTGTSGNTVTLGFKPAFVMIKRTDSAGDWNIRDNTRSPVNPVGDALYPNLSFAEYDGTETYINMTDTGFELVGNWASSNASGATYIYAAFKDQREAAFWRDFSGNGNHWQPNNLDFNDSVVDVPTNYGTDTGVGAEVRGNYATLNPLDKDSDITLSNGNLDASTSTVDHNMVRSTIAIPSSGKWYAEMSFNQTMTGNPAAAFALIAPTSSLSAHPVNAGNYSVYGSSTTSLNSGATSGAAVTGMTSGQIWQFAVDADNGYAWVGLNNSWFNVYTSGATTGDPANGTNPTFTGTMAGLFFGADFVNSSGTINFGQRPFAYAAPTGFKALCTTNLPDPAIADGSTAFNAVLYAGTSPSTNSVTGVGFQPDLVWVKSRTSGTRWHENYDVLRPNKKLSSNATDAEYTENMTFDADGFTTSGGVGPNETGNNYVGWCWKAGGTGVSNTDGSITSTVSANPTAGFSIVTYTGTGANATVGHGLGVAPKLVITKNRTSAVGWGVMAQAANSGSGHLGRLLLNETASWASTSEYWNNTAPTSSVFSVGTNSITNASGANLVAYCFAPVEGYSAFGSYTGNGSADGPFVYTGFKPAFILVKADAAGYDWYLMDNERPGYNANSYRLTPNTSNAEYTNDVQADFLSNGFKLRSGNANYSGTNYYAAFAENPFKYSLAR